MQVDQDAVGVFQNAKRFRFIHPVVDFYRNADLLENRIFLFVAAVSVICDHHFCRCHTLFLVYCFT